MLTPSDMATYPIAPLSHADVVSLLSDVTIGAIHAASSPFDLLEDVGMEILHPFTIFHGGAVIRFAYVAVDGWGWMPIRVGPSLTRTRARADATALGAWETTTDKFGMLARALTQPVTGVQADLPAVLLSMSESLDSKSVYNDGYWSAACHLLTLTLDHLHENSPEEFDAISTLIGLAHPHAITMVNHFRVWLSNDLSVRRNHAHDWLCDVTAHTWPSFVASGTDFITEAIVENFLAELPYEEWTDLSVQNYLRTQAALPDSPVRIELLAEFRQYGDFLPFYGRDRGGDITLSDYDFFLHPERRRELGTVMDSEELAALEARYAASGTLGVS